MKKVKEFFKKICEGITGWFKKWGVTSEEIVRIGVPAAIVVAFFWNDAVKSVVEFNLALIATSLVSIHLFRRFIMPRVSFTELFDKIVSGNKDQAMPSAIAFSALLLFVCVLVLATFGILKG
jgi:hypothetical protein